MAKTSDKTNSARQIELVMRKLGGVSTIPSIAAGVLNHLERSPVDMEAIAEIIESDAALSLSILSLARERGLDISAGSVRDVLEQLDEAVVRDAVLSVKVFQAFDVNYDPDSSRVLPRRELVLHCLGVGCCGKLIAERLGRGDSELVYIAGLLHDVGKLALDEAMPKSYERIVSQARFEGVSIRQAENANLGIDHTIIGKRLAEKWGLGAEVREAIWLHHSAIEEQGGGISAGPTSLIIRLSDLLVRRMGIGCSGSYDKVDLSDKLLASVGISADDVSEIEGQVRAEVDKRKELLGLEKKGASSRYCEAVGEIASQLSSDNNRLSAENTRLNLENVQSGFAADLLGALRSDMQVDEVGGDLARRWQRFYQTGVVCVFYSSLVTAGGAEAVVLDEKGSVRTVVFEAGEDENLLAAGMVKDFCVLDAVGNVDIVIERAGLDIDSGCAKVVPLVFGGRGVCGLIFEDRIGGGSVEAESAYKMGAQIGGAVMALAMSVNRERRLSERLAGVLDRSRDSQQEVVDARAIQGLAEFAAGAGHELNNPLAVICGRAELLSDVESDDQKKKMLDQISERAQEIAGIVKDLMKFARPEEPKFESVELGGFIDECLRQVSEEKGISDLEVLLEGFDEGCNVLVDADQMRVAVCNIINNSLESYNGGNGPIWISVQREGSLGAVRIDIADKGVGMDEQGLSLATKPFYSLKKAGRQRGMGLSHAQRLINLNHGRLDIQSDRGAGTVVSIILQIA